MNVTCTIFDRSTGEIDHVAKVSPATFEHYVTSGVCALLDVAGDKRTHYVDVATLKLVAYSESERAALAGLKPGWVWRMPERRAVDLRSVAQRNADEVQAIDRARAAAYPPLADLADAIYWQSTGDDGRMKAYLAAVAAVKTRIQKPKGK